MTKPALSLISLAIVLVNVQPVWCQVSLDSPTDEVQGTTYVPVDSWVYAALLRLQALGLLDSSFAGLRPWTRVDVARMLTLTSNSEEIADASPEALTLFAALAKEFRVQPSATSLRLPQAHIESQYTRMQGIAGTPLRDSFHLGQTEINDYGRPYEQGLNAILGVSAAAVAGRASLYVRMEYQHAPAAQGYSPALAAQLAAIDQTPDTPQPTIPLGPIAAANNARIVEANFSYRMLNHQISFGKSDHWLGPAQGGSLLWSNNAEEICAFQVDRSDALHIPYFSQVFGPVRYVFLVGSLKGHTVPNDPCIHVEKISLKPTRNLKLGFSRATIWGGKRHAPITVGTFLHSFFSFQNVSIADKLSRNDPGDRIGNFDFSYRLPLLRKWATLYCDSLAHDDVSPVSAPRRAAVRPGWYLSQLPAAHSFDLRLEAAKHRPTRQPQQRRWLSLYRVRSEARLYKRR